MGDKRSSYVMPGDIVFTRGTSLLGRLIRWAETGKGEEKTWANHVGVVVKAGHIVPSEIGGELTPPAAVVVEALMRVECWEWWPAHKDETGAGLMVYAPRIPEFRRAIIARAAEKFVGDKYGWWKLFFHLADRALFGGKKVFSSMLRIDKRPICSYVAAVAAAQAGVSFGMIPRSADPDEMLDYCQSHPEEFACVVNTYVE